MENIRLGVAHFRSVVFPQMRETYEKLADKQAPEVLFLTCGDSRIDPLALTGTGPGQLFVERTPGNIVPIYDDLVAVGVSASIEYAVVVLGVKDIIVCGHSACGAMKAVLHDEELQSLPATTRWLKFAQPALDRLRSEDQARVGDVKRLAELNVVEQLSHMHTHPSVALRVKAGTLGLHGWMYEIHTGTVEAYDSESNTFLPIE